MLILREIKPYWQCATRLENRGADPPTAKYVASLVEGLKLSGVEAIWHSAVDPRARPLFPSRVFPDCHPEANFEAFRYLLDSVHDLGISVLSWYPLNHCDGVLITHPEWQMQFYDIEGTDQNPEWNKHYVCINSPYGKLLPEFAAEVVRDVGFDGIWFDGSTFSNHNTGPWSLPGCKCDFCRERFKNDTGLPLPEKIDYDDRTFKEWVLWRYDVLMGIWKACLDAVLAVKKDGVVCFNNYRRGRNNPSGWNRAIPMRGLGWNCIMASELDGFPHQADFQMKMQRAYGCSYSPETWWALCDHFRLWVPDHDPLPAIQAHLGAMAAGGSCSMGMGVDVKLFSPVLRAIEDQAGPRVEFNGGREMEYAAIWCSQRYQDFGCRDNPTLAWDQWHGANEICRHSHLQTAVVFDDHIESGDIDRYPVLLVGETRCISRVQADALRRYVESGGVLVAYRDVGTLDEWGEPHDRPVLDDLLGIASRRPGEGRPTLEITDESVSKTAGSYVTYNAPFVVGTPIPEAKLLAQVVERTTHSWDGINDTQQPSPRSPGLWIRRVGKGAVVWTGVDIFRDYLLGPTPQMRKLFSHIMKELRPPRIELDGPICVTINTRIREDGIWMIHLHNCPGTAYAYPAPPRGSYTHTPGEVVPVHHLTLRPRGQIVEKAYSGITGQVYNIDDGRTIHVPILELHDIALVTCRPE